MERRLFLDVVVREGAAILKLLASEDETLLIRGDALLVLDLTLDVVDCVGRFDLCMGSDVSSGGKQLESSAQLTSSVMVFPVKVLTKICIFAVTRGFLVREAVYVWSDGSRARVYEVEGSRGAGKAYNSCGGGELGSRRLARAPRALTN